MDFNISLANLHPNDRASESLSRLTSYIMRSISIVGHNITFSSETFHPSAINLIFESFNIHTASVILELKKKNHLKIGVIATELMTLDGFPYGPEGIVVGSGFATTQYLIDRFTGFSMLLTGVDFLWCFLERTATIYSEKDYYSYHYPYGFVEPYLPPSYRRCNKDIDVIFFGTATKHRIRVIESLIKDNISVVTIGRGWSSPYMSDLGLSTLLDRSKIGLNLTLTSFSDDGLDPRFASCARITEMLNHDLLVVSEEIPHDNPYNDFIISRPLKSLSQCISDLLNNFDSQQGFQFSSNFRSKYRAEELCKPTIDKTLLLYPS